MHEQKNKNLRETRHTRPPSLFSFCLQFSACSYFLICPRRYNLSHTLQLTNSHTQPSGHIHLTAIPCITKPTPFLHSPSLSPPPPLSLSLSLSLSRLSDCLSACLSLSMSFCVCLSVSVCLCLPVFLSLCLCLSVCLSLSLSLCLSLSPSLSLSLYIFYPILMDFVPCNKESKCQKSLSRQLILFPLSPSSPTFSPHPFSLSLSHSLSLSLSLSLAEFRNKKVGGVTMLSRHSVGFY